MNSIAPLSKLDQPFSPRNLVLIKLKRRFKQQSADLSCSWHQPKAPDQDASTPIQVVEVYTRERPLCKAIKYRYFA